MDAYQLYKNTGNKHALDERLIPCIALRVEVERAAEEMAKVGQRTYDHAVTHMVKQRELQVALSDFYPPKCVVDNTVTN